MSQIRTNETYSNLNSRVVVVLMQIQEIANSIHTGYNCNIRRIQSFPSFIFFFDSSSLSCLTKRREYIYIIWVGYPGKARTMKAQNPTTYDNMKSLSLL